MKTLCRQELYDLVWATPMKTLAAQLGLSDVGLKKACAKASIPTPDRGYWAKREVGKERSQPLLPKRDPGMSDEVVLGGRHHWFYGPSEKEILGPLPSAPEFSEPMESVRQRIVTVIGEVKVHQQVKNWHPAIESVLKEDERRREQQLLYSWRESPKFDSPIERRRLRILNSLFWAAAKVNGRPTIRTQEPQSIQISFYQQHVGLKLASVVQRHRGPADPKSRSTDETKLTFSILRSIGSEATREAWQDEDQNKIETRITEIAIQVILTAEMEYREGKLHQYEWRVKYRAELEEKERQRKIDAEREERARQKRIEQARIDRLLNDAAAFQQANAIRKYIETLQSVQANREMARPGEFDRWRNWALAQADRIDPAIGRNFLAAMQDEES